MNPDQSLGWVAALLGTTTLWAGTDATSARTAVRCFMCGAGRDRILASRVLTIVPHPLLDAHAFTTRFPRALGQMPSPDWLVALLRPDAQAPLASDDTVRAAVRDLL